MRSIRTSRSVRRLRFASRRPGIPSLLLPLVILTMYADLYLGDLDIGPASSRIYLLAIASIGLAILAARDRIDIVPSRSVGILLGLYGAFILWAFINTMVRDGALGDTVRNLGTTLIFGWLLLIATQAVMQKTRDVVVISVALFASAALSSLVAIFQWLDIEAAWDLARLVRPDERFDSFDGVAGLALFSVPLSYHLGAIGALLIGPAIWWRLRWKSASIVMWAVTGAVWFGILLTVSRSAVAAGLLSLLAVIVVQVIRRPGRDYSTPIRWKRSIARAGSLAVAAVVGTVILAILFRAPPEAKVVPGRDAFFSLARITSTFREDRNALTDYAIDSWLESPLIGNQPAYDAGWAERQFDDHSIGLPRLPHNLVLNSLILYGAIGTAIILSFVALAIWIGASAVRGVYRHPILGPLAVSAMVGLFWFLLNAQFHNESFVSGSSLGMWLVAILIGIQRVARTRSPSPV